MYTLNNQNTFGSFSDAIEASRDLRDAGYRGVIVIHDENGEVCYYHAAL